MVARHVGPFVFLSHSAVLCGNRVNYR